jgi:hypothetical protein
LSVLTYTYLYSFHSSSSILTPHVLSEWMVEVWCWEWYRFWLGVELVWCVGCWAGGW